MQGKLKTEFFGPSYSVFVGKQGYPEVSAGPMVALEEREGIDSPAEWFGMEYGKIIELRSFLIRSKQREGIFSRSRFVLENQELALATKAVDTEVTFKKAPSFSFTLSDAIQPMGPSGTLERMRVTENVHVKARVERIVGDELKATEQVHLLHQAGLDVHKITSIFSSGVLGEAKKLVPSRWSTTAVDDTVAKKLLEKVRDYPSVNEYHVFEAEHLDNHFVILLAPGNWEYENFETWAPGSNWSAQTQSNIIPEYEPFQGRRGYAHSQAGGYYAARISAVQHLARIKRQARVVSFREVGEGYTVPLGVFVVRNVSREAFTQRPKVFENQEQALHYIGSRLKVPIEEYRKKSAILKQRRLGDFSWT